MKLPSKGAAKARKTTFAYTESYGSLDVQNLSPMCQVLGSRVTGHLVPNTPMRRAVIEYQG